MGERFQNKEIVIFNSPLYHDSWDDKEDHLPPLGLGYIITGLKNAGVSAVLIDSVYEKLGAIEIAKIINSNSFGNIGLNVFSVNLPLIKEILYMITRSVHVYLGGKAVAHLWKEIFSWHLQIPITVIIGEGELILPDLIKGQSKQVPVYKDDKNTVMMIDKHSVYYPCHLDDIPIDRMLFQERGILNHYGRIEHCIIASRGCIYNCAFCGGSTYANPCITPRQRSVNSLASEIRDILVCAPKTESIRVLDDLFLRDRKSLVDAVSLFTGFPRLHWRCMAHVKSLVGNLDLLKALKDSGCDEVFVGIESGNPDVRKFINKQGTVENVVEVVTSLLNSGIDVKGYFICGFPEETIQQLQDSVNLANKLKNNAEGAGGNFRAVAFQFRPYHGTQLYDYLIQGRGNDFTYSLSNKSIARRKQYNFSAGNFSNATDEELEASIKQIME